MNIKKVIPILAVFGLLLSSVGLYAPSVLAQTTNLALNKPATASSVESGTTFTANLAVDGSTTTRWSSAYSDPQWIYVDLQATTSISRVVLRWEAAYGKSYQIQTSPDASTWTTIYSTTTSDGGVDDLTGLSGSGRYVRMYGTVRALQWGYSLFEFEVYGTSGPTATNTPTRTNTPIGPTATRTNTPVGPTNTPTNTPTRTNTPSASTNLALNKPATASTTYSTYVAGNAVDGNSSTWWWSNGVPPQWIYVDLGTVSSVSQVKVQWGTGDYATTYQIQTKVNAGDAWTTQLSVTGGTGGQQTHNITTVNARYVQLNITGSPGPNVNWIQLYNFEVYGVSGPTPTPTQVGATTIKNIIPMPVSISSTGGTFTLPSTADIYVNPNNAEMIAIGQYLANKLNPSTGYGLTVIGTTTTPPNGNIYLTTIGGSSALGTEGYDLTVTTGLVTLQAFQPTGLFRGLQTIRQMLPPSIEKSTVQAGPFTLATGTVHDLPRFGYRGHMLDVARHFFTVAELKRQIDNLAYYKLNYFHIHLSDDQGWRIVINNWSNLTAYGSQTEVNISGRTGDESCVTANDGGPCYYTQAQYTDIVNYAAARYITIVPEIDMPGHTNAALASYASLNCNGIAPARRTDTAVGYSTLCVTQPIPAATTNFMNAVIDQLTAITPGPYFHIGGDESNATALADYKNFVSQAQARVILRGKKMLGWEETAQIADYSSTSVAQHWNTGASFAPTAVSKGAKVLMSPCPYAYLDIKYDASNPAGLGLSWCGTDSVSHSYSWDPATLVAGVPEASVLGVEGPLWAETIITTSDIDQLAWPRLTGLAEIGWSPTTGRNWTEYKVRLGSHGSRLTNMGINFFHSTEVTWQ